MKISKTEQGILVGAGIGYLASKTSGVNILKALVNEVRKKKKVIEIEVNKIYDPFGEEVV